MHQSCNPVSRRRGGSPPLITPRALGPCRFPSAPTARRHNFLPPPSPTFHIRRSPHKSSKKSAGNEPKSWVRRSPPLPSVHIPGCRHGLGPNFPRLPKLLGRQPPHPTNCSPKPWGLKVLSGVGGKHSPNALNEKEHSLAPRLRSLPPVARIDFKPGLPQLLWNETGMRPKTIACAGHHSGSQGIRWGVGSWVSAPGEVA
jgi:hypothetical protein